MHTELYYFTSLIERKKYKTNFEKGSTVIQEIPKSCLLGLNALTTFFKLLLKMTVPLSPPYQL